SPRRQRALLLNEIAGKSGETNLSPAKVSDTGWPATMMPEARRETLKSTPQSLATQQEIAAGQAVKIQVRQSGWYRITQPELVAAGFDPSTDARLLQLYVDGAEVPIALSNSGPHLNTDSALEFYGVGLDLPTTDTHVYWLIKGSSPGKRINGKSDRWKLYPNKETPVRSFDYTAERREKVLYFANLLNGDAENIFGAPVLSEPVNQTLTVRNLDTDAATAGNQAELEVALQGLTAGTHQVQLQINGTQVGTVTFGARQHPVQKFSINRSLLREGDNAVSLVATGGDSDISLIDWIRLTYAHQYRADQNSLRFSVASGQTVRVDGFTTPNVRVLDITNPNSPLEPGSVVESSGGVYALRVAAANNARTLLAFADDLAGHPASVAANQPSNWNAASNAANMVIITHKDFREAVEPLAALRRSQGLSVAVVDVEDVYDEFSFGAHTPLALKNFLSFANSHWSTKPTYLLLVGDSSWDPRNYLDQGENDFVPTKLIDTAHLETGSDDWLADFNNVGLANMAIGRLPGRTAAEVNLMVSKILSYEQERELNVPLRGAVMVADNGFESRSSQTQALLPPGVEVQAINRAEVSNDDVMRGQIFDALNSGPMIVNYYGHGSVTVWTSAGLLDSDLANTLTNANKPSVYVMMTCLNGYAHDVYIDSLAEAALKAQNGGAVAVWASSGFTDAEPQFALDLEFYRLLFGSQPLRLGEATRSAKAGIADADVRRTWTLLGDPAMRVR
ncbi:MAG TPA: C25 family cysteine peptidase, partial [Pyrinomonadaceae bacterium]